MGIGRFVKRPYVKLTQQQLALSRSPFARTRREGGFLELGANRTNHHGITHPVDSVNPEIWTIKIGTQRVMHDTVTPGYLYRQRRGDVINTAAWSKSETYRPGFSAWALQGTAVGSTDCTVVTSGYVGAAFEGYGLTALGPSSIPNNLVSVAKHVDIVSAQAYSRVEEPKTLSLVTAAEMGKTLSLVTGTATKVANLLDLIGKGGTIRAAAKLLNRRFPVAPVPHNVTGPLRTWLEWRYGWGPMLMDINGTLQGLASGDFVLPRSRVQGKSIEMRTYSMDVAGTYSPFGRPNHGSYKIRHSGADEVSVKSYILYTADLKFQSANAFGITDIGSTAWELIPFSFVVDWFVNVGDWIQAWQPRIGVQYLATGYTVTQKRTLFRDITSFTAPNTGDGHDYLEAGTLVGHRDEYVETTIWRVPNLPLPVLPRLDVNLNPKRLLDAVALLATNAKRLRV